MSPKTAGFPAKTTHERSAWKADQIIIGIDEAGRGALAGPVVIAAVSLFPKRNNKLLRDSKLLNADQRHTAFEWIVQNSIYSTIIYSQRLVDRHNIYRATQRGMHRAIFQLCSNLKKQPDIIIADAMPLFIACQEWNPTILSPIRAEQESVSVAAASIVAKYTRDRIMENINMWCKHHNFAQHKGYGTSQHRSDFTKHGTTIFHRNSFAFHTETTDLPFQKKLFTEKVI